jgi:hypothetical protein
MMEPNLRLSGSYRRSSRNGKHSRNGHGRLPLTGHGIADPITGEYEVVLV